MQFQLYKIIDTLELQLINNFQQDKTLKTYRLKQKSSIK